MAAPSILVMEDYAAQRFRVDLDDLEEFAGEMTPELGCLCVICSTDGNGRTVTAFTHRGLE